MRPVVLLALNTLRRFVLDYLACSSDPRFALILAGCIATTAFRVGAGHLRLFLASIARVHCNMPTISTGM
jgi:hypothetical protein